jgi:Fur family ferric uptake transcriptional regulator
VLRHAEGHLSPTQIFDRARRTLPGLTQPTVYRTLEFLASTGMAWKTNLATGHLVYELAGRKHGHLVCRECGDQIEIEPKVLDAAYRRLESISGYSLDQRHINFSGLCPKCRKRRNTRGGNHAL